MIKKYLKTFSMLVCSFLIMGCSGPVITLRHHLGGAVDMGQNPVAWHVGTFEVQPDSLTDLPLYLKNQLQKRISNYTTSTSIAHKPDSPASSLTVTGAIIASAEAIEGMRSIRQWNAQRQQLENVEVPSLQRQVTLKVHFVLHNSSNPAHDVTLETYRSYSTNQDPMIRGEEGLLRADDPQRVPSVDSIAQKLVDECLGDFIAMIQPYEITAAIPLRRVWGGDAGKGLRAAKQGDYTAAAQFFQAALAAKPDHAALYFNLAVMREADGDWAGAETYYRLALEQQPSDELSQTGLERVMRLRQIQDYEQKLLESFAYKSS